MKYIVFALLLWGCTKQSNSSKLTGVWEFKEYEGGIPFVPASNRFEFTATGYKRFDHLLGDTSGTYELIDVHQTDCTNQPRVGLTKKIVLSDNFNTTPEFINIRNNELRFVFCTSSSTEAGIALVYRKN